MKTEYLLVDFDKIVKYDFTSNEKINMEELLSTSNLPEEYKKFVLCHHRGFNVNFYGTIQLGDSHNIRFFELLSNHPFNSNFDKKNKNRSFYSSTFGGYLQIPKMYKNFEIVSEEKVINFYKTLQDNNLFEEYANFIYTIFTNAYDKSYPPIPKKLSLYREKVK